MVDIGGLPSTTNGVAVSLGNGQTVSIINPFSQALVNGLDKHSGLGGSIEHSVFQELVLHAGTSANGSATIKTQQTVAGPLFNGSPAFGFDARFIGTDGVERVEMSFGFGYIGRWDDSSIDQARKHFGFVMVSDINGVAKLRIECGDGTSRTITPVEIPGNVNVYENNLYYGLKIGGAVYFYVNTILVGIVTTNVPAGTPEAHLFATMGNGHSGQETRMHISRMGWFTAP